MNTPRHNALDVPVRRLLRTLGLRRRRQGIFFGPLGGPLAGPRGRLLGGLLGGLLGLCLGQLGAGPALAVDRPAAKAPKGALRLVPLFPAPADAPTITAGTLKKFLPRDGRPSLAELGNYDPVQDLEAAPLNLENSRWLFRHQWGAVEATLFVTDVAGKILGAESFKERTPEVNLVDLVGDGTREIIVSVIAGTALSDWPTGWQIFELKRGKHLHRIGELAASHEAGAKKRTTLWRNEITAPERGLLRAETTTFTSRGERPDMDAPTAAGEVRSFTFQKKKGRYVEDPESRKAHQLAHKAWTPPAE